MSYEAVIGLEAHVELKTATKLFCGCANEFGAEPNTHICPVCLGLPGSLPVLNRNAVELAMRIGTALNCEIRPSIFHRKNYFYPDMPKDYQVSQYDEPINVEGFLELSDGTRVGIVRAHMEEDTGKTVHVGGGGREGARSSARGARSRTSTRSGRGAGPSSTRPAGRSACSRPARWSIRRP